MLMIILNHYSFYGEWEDFSKATFSWQIPFIQIIHIGGTVAVDIFMLITGFYSYNRKPNWKKWMLLILEVYFYGIVIYGTLFATGLIDFSLRQFVRTVLLPTFYGNWYIVYYLLFFVFIPVLNKIIEKLDRKWHLLLVTIWLLCCIITTVLHALSFGNLFTFIGFYFVGSYLNKYGIDERKLKIASSVAIIVLLISPVVFDYIGIIIRIPRLLSRVSYFDANLCIFVVVTSIALFKFFKGRFFRNGIINTVASTVLGIYLIHDNENVRMIIWEQWWPNSVMLNSNMIWIHALTKSLIVFTVCCVIELIRQRTFGKWASFFLEKKWGVIETNIVKSKFLMED